MSDKIIKIGNNVIEIHNNWIGVQTVLVNGEIVSKKFSISGNSHFFTIRKDGYDRKCILTTKLSSKQRLIKNNQVLIDLRCDGKIIKENFLINFGTNKKGKINQKKETNEHKITGIKLLREYEIENAINALEWGLELDRNDPEIYFYLACCYSIQEKKKDGFECIKKAVENNLNDTEIILNHEMLAYLRVQDGFEAFKNSNFTKYD